MLKDRPWNFDFLSSLQMFPMDRSHRTMEIPICSGDVARLMSFLLHVLSNIHPVLTHGP